MSGIGWYRISRLPRYSDDISNFKIVTSEKFRNEKIPLDGVEYTDCDFENVTFIFEGTTPIRMPKQQNAREHLDTVRKRVSYCNFFAAASILQRP
jgi:hypothetical protein